MQAKPKPEDAAGSPVSAPEPAPPSGITAGDPGPGTPAHASPARALQARLARELAQPGRPWLWHSAGLVMVVILSFWVAGLMLNAGY